MKRCGYKSALLTQVCRNYVICKEKIYMQYKKNLGVNLGFAEQSPLQSVA